MANGVMCTFLCYTLVTLKTHKVKVHPSLPPPPISPSLSLSLFR